MTKNQLVAYTTGMSDCDYEAAVFLLMVTINRIWFIVYDGLTN